MKKMISFLLTLTLLLSLCSISALADASTPLTFDLSCEGSALSSGVNKISKVDQNTVLTVSFSLVPAAATQVSTVQNYIDFDPGFFEFVPGSLTVNGNFDVTDFSANHILLYSTMDGANLSAGANPVGSFQLKVISDMGQSTVKSTFAAANDTKFAKYTNVTTQDLCVRVTDKFKMTFLNGSSVVKEETVRDGGSVNLPAAPTKQYYSFLYWKIDGDDTRYQPGEKYTPTNNTTFKAVFEGVPAPARPIGLDSVRTTAPDISDGKITGTTAKMEYDTDTAFSAAKPCGEGETTDLLAGTYYVRVKAEGNTPPGEYTAVGIPAGSIPAAPMGLTALKTSAPGAKDGKIRGTSERMEWSTTTDFGKATACTGSEITGLAAGTYYVRLMADTENRIAAGSYATVSVPEGQIPAAPTGLAAVKTTLSGTRDGKITGTTTKMEWSTTEDFAELHSCTGTEILGLAAGVYYVRFRADVYTNTCAGTPAAVVVPSGELPAAPTGLKGISTSAPGAKDGGIKGTTSKMEYSTTASFAKPFDCDDGATEGLTAGTYFVRYKADPVTGAVASNAVAIRVEDGRLQVSELFTDVSDKSFCADAVLWAVEKGITKGATATTFAPGSSCTRAQVVTFLWRAAGSPKPRAAANPFTDVKAGAYYYDAVLWAVENGITNGATATTFGTNKSVTRGQFVTFLCRSQKGAASVKNTAFTDVSASAYYADAVAWAVENGVTTGLTATTFGPSRTCNRGQVVTFLYRCFVK